MGKPTYAPQVTPIEKVWRTRYVEVLHLPRRIEQWDTLQAAAQTWLDHVSQPNIKLLRSYGPLCAGQRVHVHQPWGT